MPRLTSIAGHLPVLRELRQLRHELGHVARERDDARRERDDALRERDDARRERDQALHDRDETLRGEPRLEPLVLRGDIMPARPGGHVARHAPGRARPEIVLVGACERAYNMLSLYGLHGSEAVAITDREPWKWHRRLGPNIVRAPMDIDFSQVGWIMLGEPYREHEVLQFLEAHGAPTDRGVTTFQAKSLHDRLCMVPGAAPIEPHALGHAAIYHDVFEKAWYAYGVLIAAEQAKRMGLSRVTIVELGVWFGMGLKSLCEICAFLTATTGMEFDIYGFDTGAGLPPVADYRDHPELWGTGDMKMPDFQALAAELPPNCRLLIGDVRETIPKFLAEQASPESPVGFVSLDVDLYTSSVDALKLLDADAACLLPAVGVWEDDSYCNVLQNSHCGEALAIKHFNDAHELRKIDKKVVRTNRPQQPWHHMFYFAHIFDHPLRRSAGSGSRFDLFFHWFY